LEWEWRFTTKPVTHEGGGRREEGGGRRGGYWKMLQQSVCTPSLAFTVIYNMDEVVPAPVEGNMSPTPSPSSYSST